MGEQNDNPRMMIWGTDLQRTLAFMDLLEDEDDLDEKVRAVISMLGNCFPVGTERDLRGASFKQTKYISLLAGFDLDQVHEFCRLVNLAGGLDSGQGHHLIDKLKGT